MALEKEVEFFAVRKSEEVIKLLESGLEGLSVEEAKSRLTKFGKNVPAARKEVHVVIEFLLHFKSPLTIILLLACAVSIFFGEQLQAVVIAGIVLLGVTINFFLEHDAGKAAEKLRDQVRTKALVIRANEQREVPIEDVVPGDIVLLRPGSMIPADGRVVAAKYFFVNQSSLTGESFPCAKTSLVIKKAGSLTELDNMVFMGTHVISGEAKAVIVRTGGSTEFGKIAKRLEAAPIETEFDKGITKFGYLIMKTTIFLVLFIFLFNSLVKHNYLQSFFFSVAVAVGLTPELLPMIMSVTMARGSLDMAKKGAIVKRLASIPNFGSMDVLCTDKTGTLTEDKIRLVKYSDVFGNHSEDVLLHTYLNSFHQTGMDNPLDRAVLEFKKIRISEYKKVDEIPFDFARKRISVVVSKGNSRFLITKGAPEEVLKCCSFYCHGKKRKHLVNQEKVTEVYKALSKEGFRVLAVAVRKIGRKKLYGKHDERDLELLGFVSFLDPPKQDVGHILHELMNMGIEVKVVTGDNELVTKKICDEVGLHVKGILLGDEIKHLSDEALRVRAESATVFARVSPQEKSRIILALKQNNHVVGYLGDGINDSPPLLAADISISVNTAADVAKEAAAIVLTRKSLSELKEGVLEGRRTFGNTLKYIMMSLSSNFGNMFSVAIATLFLPFLPMLPIQILLNNFIYDFSQVTIPTDNVDEDFIRKPKRWNSKFIKLFMLTFGPISSIFDLLTFVLLYFIFRVPEAFFQTGWFMESLATQTFVIFIIRTRKTPFLESRPSRYLLLSSLICVCLGWILPYTPVGKFFGFVSPPAMIVFVIIGIVVMYLLIVEAAKDIFYKKHDF